MTDNEILAQRKQKLFDFLKQKWVFIALICIITLGLYVRSYHNDTLKDSILELDPYLFLRWINTIVDTGSLPKIDMMRAYPLGFDTEQESLVMPYAVAYLYKVLHFLDPRVTTTNALSWYPLFAFAISIIPFFLLIKELFGKRTAVLASFFLAVVPGYLFRTYQSYGDKEPLALFTMYMAMYFFVKAWYYDDKKIIQKLIWSAMAGIWAGIMAMTWGGTAILYIACGGFAIINFLLWFRKQHVMVYGTWLAFYVIFSLSFTLKYGGWSLIAFQFLFSNVGSLLAVFTLGVGVACLMTEYLSNKVKAIQDIKLPLSAKALAISAVIGLVMIIATGSGAALFARVLEQFIHPFERARHTLTVAENRQPYFPEWGGEFTTLFLWAGILGAVLLFWDMMSDFKYGKSGIRWMLTGLFAFMISGILFSRVGTDSAMNGVSGLSIIYFMGSLLLFFGVMVFGYFWSYFKDKETFKIIEDMDLASIKPWFIVFFLVECMIAARGAARLFTILAPAIAIVGAYFFVSLWNKASSKFYKVAVGFAFLIIAVQLLSTTFAMTRAMGPSMTPNWIETGNWIKENTPKESVFAHWWDYGYWVQTLGERATVLDGGQPMAPWNYLLGRHLLTAQNESEALNFLYAHNVSYLLIDPSDIGKYPAYASIGSDTNYDRLSYVTSFVRDPVTQHKYLYTGQYAFDEDYISTTGKKYLAQQGGILGVEFEMTISNTSMMEVSNPKVNIVGAAGQEAEPLQCVNINGHDFTFDVPGYAGCFVVLTSVDTSTQQLVEYDAGLMLSRRGRNALWTKLYLRGFDRDNPYFVRVFDSQPQQVIFVKNNGAPFGPITIWKVNYPDGMTVDPEMLSTVFPEGTFME